MRTLITPSGFALSLLALAAPCPAQEQSHLAATPENVRWGRTPPLAGASAPAQQPRVSLTFITDQTDDLLPVVKEAQAIWASEGHRILQVMEDVSGLKFEEKAIVVIVHRAASVSGAPIPTSPLKLNARYPVRMSLVHELGHRLTAFHIRNLPKDWPTGHGGLDNHKLLYLFLYDVWAQLYGRQVAEEWVQTEKQWADLGFGFIKDAWEWALSLGEQGRASKLREITAGIARERQAVSARRREP